MLHAGVLAGGTQAHDFQAVEQQRTQRPIGCQQEWQIVAAGVGHVLVALSRQQSDVGDQHARDRAHTLGVCALDLIGLQDLPELADQGIGPFAVFELISDQLLLRGVLQVLDQADEQVGRIVERLAILGADEDRGQRIALDRDQFGQLGGIECAGHRPELLELRHRDIDRWQLLGQDAQALDVPQVMAHFLVGWAFGLALEPVPIIVVAAWWCQQQVIDQRPHGR